MLEPIYVINADEQLEYANQRVLKDVYVLFRVKEVRFKLLYPASFYFLSTSQSH